MGRIAIMQYEWPLQSHTLNFVKALADRGHQVDFFTCRCSRELVDIDCLRSCRTVRHIEVDGGGEKRQGVWERLQRRITRAFRQTLGRVSFAALLIPSLRETLRRSREQRYDLAIGVEKSGVIWASLLHRLTGTPFVYFSLELYDEDHPYFVGRPGFAAWRRAESTAHRLAMSTIIQDRQRGDHLLRSNGLDRGEMIYFPVSVSGDPLRERSDYFRERFAIPPERKIILYLGLIDEPRGCLELARCAGAVSRDAALVFHGYGDKKVVDRVRVAGGASLILSLDMVKEHDLPQVVSSADIGLALYRRDCANDLLTACSSEKVALYCRAGIPFIAFESESFRALKERYDCCELIDSVAGLPRAVDTIIGRYDYYRENAFRAFSGLYCYEKNVGAVIEGLSRFLGADTYEPIGAAGT